MKLRKILLRYAAFVAIAALGCSIGAAWAGSDEEIIKNSKNPDLWPDMAQNLGLQRHSDLKDINKEKVGNLQLAWSQSTGALRGHVGQPVVVNVDGKPMMFFVSAWPNIVQALDLSNPDNPVQVWSYNKDTDRDVSAVPRSCCDVVNRGVNYAEGKRSSIGRTASSLHSTPRPARNCGSPNTRPQTGRDHDERAPDREG
jgi:lanthanide-dependent methanol dehydrogenase